MVLHCVKDGILTLFTCRDTWLLPAFGYCQPCCYERGVVSDTPNKHLPISEALGLWELVLLAQVLILWAHVDLCHSHILRISQLLFADIVIFSQWWCSLLWLMEGVTGTLGRLLGSNSHSGILTGTAKPELASLTLELVVRWWGCACFSLNVRHSAQRRCFFFLWPTVPSSSAVTAQL